MARSFLIVAALLGAFVAYASAQCIECNKCTPGNSYCLQTCQRSCQPAYDSKKCYSAGEKMGRTEGASACDLSLSYCSQVQGGRSFGGGHGAPVSLGQCQNIAYGACQSEGKKTAQWGKCHHAFNGYKACSAKQFQDFFYAELNARCNLAASKISRR